MTLCQAEHLLQTDWAHARANPNAMSMSMSMSMHMHMRMYMCTCVVETFLKAVREKTAVQSGQGINIDKRRVDSMTEEEVAGGRTFPAIRRIRQAGYSSQMYSP